MVPFRHTLKFWCPPICAGLFYAGIAVADGGSPEDTSPEDEFNADTETGETQAGKDELVFLSPPPTQTVLSRTGCRARCGKRSPAAPCLRMPTASQNQDSIVRQADREALVPDDDVRNEPTSCPRWHPCQPTVAASAKRTSFPR